MNDVPDFQALENQTGNAVTVPKGFTLIELIVVIALFGIVMLTAVPNVRHLLTDETRKVSQWILLQVPLLKTRAMSEKTMYTLHADMDDNTIWISHGYMTEDEMAAAKDYGRFLGDSVYLLDVEYDNGDVVDAGDAAIRFYPKGYSDRVILHLEEDSGDRRSFFIEPFLRQVDIAEGYVEFEG
jgi:prepilin-type N-terminal cleavage/methylation domain-containing protein